MTEWPADDTIRVLHVDDDPAFVDMAATFLERNCEQLAVTTATDTDTALALLRGTSPSFDCVISDYEMPAGDGLDFLDAVREFEPALPFFLYTGNGSETIADAALERGATDYVRKTSGTAQYAVLANRIRRVVAGNRAEREVERRLVAMETAREGICIVDADGTFGYANETYLDLYGYDEADLLGEPWQRAHPDEEVETIEAEVLPQVEREGEWAGTSVGLRADGTTFPESKSVTALPDVGLVIVVTDRTEYDPVGADAGTAAG